VSRPEVLGLHGIVFSTPDPEALAARLQDLLGLPALRRTRSEIVLGSGPECFLAIRRRAHSGGASLEEIHVAVSDISRARRRTLPDPLGGDSWSRNISDRLTLTVREFRHPPRGKWRRRRPPDGSG
jgi:hypothetical protein